MNKIEFIKSMQTLEIHDNDILVVKIDKILSPETNKTLQNHIEKNLPDNIKGKMRVFIFEPGMDIGILRKEAA